MSFNIKNSSCKIRDRIIGDVVGFTLKEGQAICFFDDECTTLTTFWCWNDEICTYKIEKPYNKNTLLSTFVEGIGLCDFEDIDKVFISADDFKITLEYTL